MVKRWADVDVAAGLRQLAAYWTPARKAAAERLARQRAADETAECILCSAVFPVNENGAKQGAAGWVCGYCAERLGASAQDVANKGPRLGR